MLRLIRGLGADQTLVGLRMVIGASTFCFSAYTGQAHQPSGLLTSDSDTFTAKSMPHFPDFVDTIIFGVDHTNVFYQNSVKQTTRTQPTDFGLAVPTSGDKTTFAIASQRLTNELDRKTIPVVVNEADHLLSFWGEFGCEKS